MRTTGSFRIRFSGLSVRFSLPAPAVLPEELTAFLCDDTGVADAEYDIRLLHTPLSLLGSPCFNNDGTMIYRLDEGWLRVYPLRIAEDGCQVACLLCPNGKNILYYPASMWDYYTNPMHCIPQLGLEVLLLQHNAFLLHSSVVEVNGQTVLFAGPSGAGKSTQAALWAKHLNAKILNGDRCVVMKRPDGFYGGGSPLAGSSKIFCPDLAPVAGIFIVNQSQENSTKRLGSTAFSQLFSQSLVNSWDTAFMARITGLFEELFCQVPVYSLNCRMDEEAVTVAYHTLF